MEEREELQLGSLLHDIGKILQRAGRMKLGSEELTLQSGHNAGGEGCGLHQHALYSMMFFREIWPDRFPVAQMLCGFHHSPRNSPHARLAKMVALANRLAAGENPSPDNEADFDVANNPRLPCLFSALDLGDVPAEAFFFPLLPLSAGIRCHFPRKERLTTEVAEDYGLLWKGISSRLSELECGADFNGFFRQVEQVLECYTTFVPSSVGAQGSGVSFFHHSKTTAAIATCLYDLNPTDDELDELLGEIGSPESNSLRNKPLIWLVGADLSGIQDFIYGVASKGALKGLRGRSAYLQLLSEAVALNVLHTFGLPSANLIYLGGGHFYVLVPAVKNVEQLLADCQKRVDSLLVRAHRGELSLCFAWESIKAKDVCSSAGRANASEVGRFSLDASCFSEAWQRLGAQLVRAKRRKFSSILADTQSVGRIFGPFPTSGEDPVCKTCGCTFQEETPREGKCPLCLSFEQLASRLARAKGMSISVSESPGENLQDASVRSCEEVFQGFGVQFRFLSKAQADAECYLLNEIPWPTPHDRLLDPSRRNNNKGWKGFRFLARHTPLGSDGEILPLDVIAKGGSGLGKWGVLRADVDHLGKVFRDGLSGENRNLAQMSMLSSLFSRFFSAQVEHLASMPDRKELISVIYAGGDDLFVVGEWSTLPEFSHHVYRDFLEFTGQRLTLSSGLFFAPNDKYPIARAGRLAGDAEQIAKGRGRDRLCIFEHALPWSAFPEVLEIYRKLVELIVDRNAPRSLLTVLANAYDGQRLASDGKTPVFPIWRLLYAFRRMIERHRDLGIPLMELEQAVVRNMWLSKHGAISVRLAEYYTRRNATT